MKKPISIILLVVLILTMLIPAPQMQAESNGITQRRFEASVSDFPQSYRSGLERVLESYPNARFIYYDTGLDWYEDLLAPENQMSRGRNLISTSYPSSWKSDAPENFDPGTGNYLQVEPGWVQASQQVIEYYMDPRNFFNEEDIFQFVSLSFDNSQTVAGTASVLSGSFMSSKNIPSPNGGTMTYAQAFYEIGKAYNVNPYLLAARARQEQGSGSVLIYGTYPGFEGYYNFFNIGAYGPTTSAIITAGLTYAKNHGWNTIYKSLEGGAAMLSSYYVKSGKDCLYLHHFNVVASDGYVSYAPYMGAIQAPYYETQSLANSYTDKNGSYVFIIPVYDNMPQMPVSLPDGDGNGNAYLKSLTIENGDVSLSGFSYDVGNYFVNAGDKDYISIQAEAFQDTSTVLFNGENVGMDGAKAETGISLAPGFNKITISVEAENGTVRDYMLTIARDDGSPHYQVNTGTIQDDSIKIRQETSVGTLLSQIQTINCGAMIAGADGTVKADDQLCASGDTLYVYDPASGVASAAIKIIIPGDLNQDGAVSQEDAEIIFTHLLQTTTIPETSLSTADMDSDGAVTIEDAEAILAITQYRSNVPETVTIKTVVESTEKTGSFTLWSEETGTYLITGVLNYNPSSVDIVSGDNNGEIRFIACNGRIYFSRPDSLFLFAPYAKSGFNVSAKIETAVDYTSGNDINAVCTVEPLQTALADMAAGIEESPCSKSGHSFTYTTKQPATPTSREVKTGVCDVCGETIQSIVNNSRLNPIYSLNLKIASAVSSQVGLPQITVSDGKAEIYESEWVNGGGVVLSDQLETVKLQSNDKYTLSSLKIKPENGYYFSDRLNISINGIEYAGEKELDYWKLSMSNVGGFAFDNASKSS